MVKRILVTGGAGFLGANLCRKLLRDSIENFIICLDNLYTGRYENISNLLKNPRFKFINHDIINPIEDMFVDEIYNLACPASPPHYQKDPIYTTKINVLGMINVAELALKHNAKLLQASTSEVYGNPKVHPQVEAYFGNVNCNGLRACYDEGKRCAESLIFDYNRKFSLRVKVVRIFNTYGPFMDSGDGRVVSNFIIQCLRQEPITIYGDGSQTRSLCYVDDLIDGLLKMMSSPDDVIGPINLGNPEEYTIEEIAYKVSSLTECNSPFVYQSLPKDDPIKRCPDISQAVRLLQWQPQVTADIGFRRTIDYFKAFYM